MKKDPSDCGRVEIKKKGWWNRISKRKDASFWIGIKKMEIEIF